MKYNWTCPANKLIDVLLKHGYKKIAFDENDTDCGTYYFSKTNDINKLDKTNIIIVKRQQIYTFVETSPEFPKDEFATIHKEVSTNLDFPEHWAYLLQNIKTKEYKFIQLQPMFIMGMIMSLGVFDKTYFIKNLKIKDTLSNTEKYKTFIKYLIKNKFKTESEAIAVFNLFNHEGTIEYQLEKHFAPDWICIGPQIEWSKPENEERSIYNTRDDILNKAEEIFGHSVQDYEKEQLKNFNFIMYIRLYSEFVRFYDKQKIKNKNLSKSDALEQFEKENGITIPFEVLDKFENIATIINDNNQMFCPHCGKIILKTSKKCEYCNKQITFKLKSKKTKKEA